MITQENLNAEKDLTRRIFGYYVDKMIDAIKSGSKEYNSFYVNAMNTNFIMKCAHSLSIVSGEVYLNRNLVGEVFYKKVRDKIREYLNSELRQIIYADLGAEEASQLFNPSEPPIIVTYTDSIHRWVSYSIIVAEDRATEISLPFNIVVADANSLTVTINDQNPDSLVAPEAEGCHIVGTTLYWHNYYDLRTGDTIVIKFDKIS